MKRHVTCFFSLLRPANNPSLYLSHTLSLSLSFWNTHTHAHPPFTWFLTYWAWTSGIYTLEIKQAHTYTHRLAHRQHQTHTKQTTSERERDAENGESGFKEVDSEWQKRFESSTWSQDVVGVKSREEKQKRKDERRAEREDAVFTLGGVWRACSLRRTSRRCCRTPSPSEEPLEPCNHEYRCSKHTEQVHVKHTLITFYNCESRITHDSLIWTDFILEGEEVGNKTFPLSLVIKVVVLDGVSATGKLRKLDLWDTTICRKACNHPRTSFSLN